MNKTEYWRQHIKAWQESGLSQVAYCASQDIKVHNLSYWRKRLKDTSPNKLIRVGVPTQITVRLILGSKVIIGLPTDHVADRGLLHATT